MMKKFAAMLLALIAFAAAAAMAQADVMDHFFALDGGVPEEACKSVVRLVTEDNQQVLSGFIAAADEENVYVVSDFAALLFHSEPARDGSFTAKWYYDELYNSRGKLGNKYLTGKLNWVNDKKNPTICIMAFPYDSYVMADFAAIELAGMDEVGREEDVSVLGFYTNHSPRGVLKNNEPYPGTCQYTNRYEITIFRNTSYDRLGVFGNDRSTGLEMDLSGGPVVNAQGKAVAV